MVWAAVLVMKSKLGEPVSADSARVDTVLVGPVLSTVIVKPVEASPVFAAWSVIFATRVCVASPRLALRTTSTRPSWMSCATSDAVPTKLAPL